MHLLRRLGVPCLALALFVLALANRGAMAGPLADPLADRSAAAPAQATLTPGHNIVVQGRILYIDQNSDRNHPAAGLKVEIWDKDEGFGKVGEMLDITRTDASGFFKSRELSNDDRDGPTNQPEGGQDIYVRLFSNNGDVRVLKTNTNLEYVWISYEINAQTGLTRNVKDGVVNLPSLVIQETTKDVEALWAYVSLAEAWLFLQDHGSPNPGQVTAFWTKTSQDGPRYDPAQKAIFLRDGDAGFRSVVVQQAAYAFADNLYGGLPAGWQAYTAGPLDDLKTAKDPAAAFIQGFATFLPLAVYADPKFESLGLRALNLDEPTPITAGWANGDTVAGRIAGAFWDLDENDGTEDGSDKYNATFQDIWQVFREKKPTTFREWWTGWHDLGKNTCDPIGSLFQNTIDYNSVPQVAPIPDIVLDEDTTRVVDLAQFVTDADCPDDKLTFTLLNAGDPQAGIMQIGTTSAISITPDANWFGTTGVSMRVSDGPSAVNLNFRVVVRSVNDCPTIKPRIDNPDPAPHGNPIVINLITHGNDVEDQPVQLTWTALLDAQNQPDIIVEGQGTSVLTFRLQASVIKDYNALVTLVLKDRDGCEVATTVVLRWTNRPNQRPWIWQEKWRSQYTAPRNTNIVVDLTDVAGDDEDGPEFLQWFPFVDTVEHASWTHKDANKQVLEFTPHDNYVGDDVIDLSVKDTGGLEASATITLTWLDPSGNPNAAPQILRNKLLGKINGKNSAACYALTDKATDPNDRQEALMWFIKGNDPKELTVDGQGTRELCLTPTQPDFEGCIPAMFLVRDPWGLEDQHEVRTCWRTIRVYFPFTRQFRPANVSLRQVKP